MVIINYGKKGNRTCMSISTLINSSEALYLIFSFLIIVFFLLLTDAIPKILDCNNYAELQVCM